MKYSTPSIEVVTFNPSDAPRIGMQWWAEPSAGGNWIALGQNWMPTSGTIEVKYGNATHYQFFNGESVTSYNYTGADIPGAAVYDWNGMPVNIVADDHKSC